MSSSSAQCAYYFCPCKANAKWMQSKCKVGKEAVLQFFE